MLSDSQISNLLAQLALSWPPYNRWMSENDLEALIECSSDDLNRIEGQRGGGQLVYMHAKLKMHADHYALHYSIPSKYQEPCNEMMKKEMRITKWWQFWKNIQQVTQASTPVNV